MILLGQAVLNVHCSVNGQSCDVSIYKSIIHLPSAGCFVLLNQIPSFEKFLSPRGIMQPCNHLNVKLLNKIGVSGFQVIWGKVVLYWSSYGIQLNVCKVRTMRLIVLIQHKPLLTDLKSKICLCLVFNECMLYIECNPSCHPVYFWNDLEWPINELRHIGYR